MVWKSVAWAGCLVPVLAGCGAFRHVPRVTDETLPSQTRREIARDQRRDARDAWRAVTARHTGRVFTTAFSDGFLDGYADYLDRGEAAHPPAVPPTKYRSASDNNPDTTEHGAIRDYYAGFRYGSEVAVASGRQSALLGAGPAPMVPFAPSTTRPATSDTGSGANRFGPKPVGSEPQKPPLDEPTRSVPPLPKPELPVIKPFNPVLPNDTKFTPPPVSPGSDQVPVPYPPLPTAVPTLPPDPVPAPSLVPQAPVIPFRFPPPPVIPTGALVPRPTASDRP